MHSNSIAQTLSSVSVGDDVAFENLVMLPLLRDAGSSAAADYLTLDESLASGFAEVTEISEQGSVPELRFVNRGPRPTLIIDGEELVGAKQNRVVNLTILVAANSELGIPVSCVEAGRWRARSRAFTAAPRTHYASGRARRMAQVTTSMVMNESYHSDQADVWSDIAAKSARLDAKSPTSAMEALFVDHGASIEKFVEGCRPVDGQVGALFAIDGVLVGLDLFDRESTLRKLLPKLVRGVAVDALDGACAGKGDSPPFPGAAAKRGTVPLSTRFLATLAATPQHVAPGVGLGEDVRLTGRGITGAALLLDGTVVHLGAFTQTGAA